MIGIGVVSSVALRLVLQMHGTRVSMTYVKRLVCIWRSKTEDSVGDSFQGFKDIPGCHIINIVCIGI